MQKLVLLDMTNNHLVYLPPSVSQCRRLKALYLSDNPVPAFPKDLLRIHGLQQLRLANTLMTGLPPELAVLTNLRELAIEGNKLIWPPQEVLAEGLEKIKEYVTDHYELLKLDMETRRISIRSKGWRSVTKLRWTRSLSTTRASRIA